MTSHYRQQEMGDAEIPPVAMPMPPNWPQAGPQHRVYPPPPGWPVYPPPTGSHRGGNSPWSISVIVILLGTFAALAFSAFVVGLVVWQSFSKHSERTQSPKQTVFYSSSPPHSNPQPAAAPPSYSEEAFAPAIDGGPPSVEATPTASLPAPVGARLELAASVNSEQTIVYLNDVSPLVGVRLPIAIRIGDERMSVTAVDEYRSALNVERTGGVYHSVSAAVEAIEATWGKVRALDDADQRVW
jgi:hypothetical protein